MTVVRNRFAASLIAANLALLPAATTAAQEAATRPAPQTPAPPAPSISDAELARIRRALATEPAFTLDDQQLRFYVEILAKQPRFADFIKDYDFVNGPTRRGNPMTHQEYLAMVTPREMYSTVGITPTDMLQFALTNWLGQALIKKALNDVQNARSEQELQAIRERIDRELQAITGGATSEGTR